MNQLRMSLARYGSQTFVLVWALGFLATALGPTPASAKQPRGAARAVTYASEEDDVIHACVRDGNGRVRVVSDTAECRPHEEPTSWNRARPPVSMGTPVLTALEVELEVLSITVSAAREFGSLPLDEQDSDSGLGRPLNASIDFESTSGSASLHGNARMTADFSENGIAIERSGEIAYFNAGTSFRHRILWRIEATFRFTVPHDGSTLTPVLIRATVDDPALDSTTGQVLVTLRSDLLGQVSVRPLTAGVVPMVAGDVVEATMSITRQGRAIENTMFPPIRMSIDAYSVDVARTP